MIIVAAAGVFVIAAIRAIFVAIALRLMIAMVTVVAPIVARIRLPIAFGRGNARVVYVAIVAADVALIATRPIIAIGTARVGPAFAPLVITALSAAVAFTERFRLTAIAGARRLAIIVRVIALARIFALA